MPFIASWPAVIEPGSSSDRIVSNTDMLATFADIVGQQLPTNAGEDSFSFLDVLYGNTSTKAVRETIVGRPDRRDLYVRKGDWKLSIYHDDRCELYDLAKDPAELKNLYGLDEYASIQNELTLDLMKRLLGVKVRDVGMNWPTEKYPIDVRFEALQKTHLDPSSITGLKPTSNDASVSRGSG